MNTQFLKGQLSVPREIKNSVLIQHNFLGDNNLHHGEHESHKLLNEVKNDNLFTVGETRWKDY